MRTRATLLLGVLATALAAPRTDEVSRLRSVSRNAADTPAPLGRVFRRPGAGARDLEWAQVATTTFGFARG